MGHSFIQGLALDSSKKINPETRVVKHRSYDNTDGGRSDQRFDHGGTEERSIIISRCHHHIHLLSLG